METKPSFAIRVTKQTVKSGRNLNALKTCYSQQLTVCARWLREGVSNMAIVDVAMVSGFEANQDSYNKVCWFIK